MLRRGRWKLIRAPTANGLRWELYDLKSDPQESRNLAAAEPERVQALRSLLEPWLEASGEPSGAAEISPELEAQLRDLAYME